mgnify:CR=1 FL=1
MKSINILIFLLAISNIVNAETIYVTEQLKLNMRRGASNQHKILKILTSGTPLTLLSQNSATGYSKVRTSSGMQGFVLTRLTQKQPAARQLLEQVSQELEQLKTENQRLNDTLLSLQTNNDLNTSETSSIIIERDTLSRELRDLKQIAGHAIQLKQQGDQLRERVVKIERENQQLKRENQALEDTSNQDWFLNGGIIAFFGIFFGLLIPKLSWQRRRSNWDSF